MREELRNNPCLQKSFRPVEEMAKYLTGYNTMEIEVNVIIRL